MSSEVLERISALHALVAQLAPATTPTVEVGQLWDNFRNAERGRLLSWRDYEQRWRDHIGPAFSLMLAHDVKVLDVDTYRGNRRAEGAAVATVNREIALLRRLLSFGVRRGMLAKSPLHGPGMTRELIHREDNVRTTVVEQAPRGPAPTIDWLVSQATPELGAFMLLLHGGGFRREEASLLRLDRIDWLQGIAWIPSEDTKGGIGGRHVPISSDALEALRMLKHVPGSPWLFPSPRFKGRGPISKDAWTHRFGRLMRKLGLDGPDGPPWLHDLRRSFVTISRRDGGESERAIMQVSGHRTRAVFDRYDIYDPRDVIEFRTRAEARRAALRAARRGPQRAPSRRAPDENIHTGEGKA